MAGRLECVDNSVDRIVHRLAVQLGELIEDQPEHLTKTPARAYSFRDSVVLVSDPTDCTLVCRSADNILELPMAGALVDPSALTLRTPTPLHGLRWKEAKMVSSPPLAQDVPVIGLLVRGLPGESAVLASIWRDSSGALDQWRDGIGRMVADNRVRFVPPDGDMRQAVRDFLRPLITRSRP